MASSSPEYLPPADAARRLGVSAKALRLYEQCGLVTPLRTAAGWRAYGPEQMARAGEIVALRGLGLSLAQTARVLAGDGRDLEVALAAHQATLEGRLRDAAASLEQVRALRTDLAQGRMADARALAGLTRPPSPFATAFDLPWPWGGERFELTDVRPITYIVGPLGSGKTRLAMRLAETIPNAGFLGLDRAEAPGPGADPALKARVDAALAWLAEDGASASTALTRLIAALEAEAPQVLVVDLVEQDLDQASQEALAAYLRRRADPIRPLILMTRSDIILDLAAVGPHEAILLCPANHGPPSLVLPVPGAPGYEAVATCLASPDVRSRTAGVIAFKPDAA